MVEFVQANVRLVSWLRMACAHRQYGAHTHHHQVLVHSPSPTLSSHTQTPPYSERSTPLLPPTFSSSTNLIPHLDWKVREVELMETKQVVARAGAADGLGEDSQRASPAGGQRQQEHTVRAACHIPITHTGNVTCVRWRRG